MNISRYFILLSLSLLLVGCNNVVKQLVNTPEIKSVRLKDFSLQNKQVVFDIDLYNPNAFPLPTKGFGGDFALNDVKIGSVKATSEKSIAAYGTQTVNLPIRFDADSLGKAMRSVLSKRKADYSINGGIDTSVGNIPFSQKGELSAKDIISQFF